MSSDEGEAIYWSNDVDEARVAAALFLERSPCATAIEVADALNWQFDALPWAACRSIAIGVLWRSRLPTRTAR